MNSSMNTLNYIGCKHTLSSKILDLMQEKIPNCREKSLLDLFAGTGTIGFHSLSLFRTVSANDWELYSWTINVALLQVPFSDKLQKYIEECNSLASQSGGLIWREYSEKGPEGRMFFTEENAKKADAIRQHLDTLFASGLLNDKEFCFLLASLLTSIDKVANTTSVYGAYLKSWKASALKSLVLVPIHQSLNIKQPEENAVFHCKAEDLVQMEKEKWDVVYLDPPYNQRQYAANYSPLNFIAEYREDVKVKGKTGLLEGYNKSDFCSKTRAQAAFQQLLDSLDSSWIVLSYNNEGILDQNTIREMLEKKGTVTLETIPYKKFKSNNESVQELQVQEYLWFCETK